jgi:putative transferase (TIGR04331 family)
MPIISNVLNKIHGLDKTEKYWRMIIAPWLGQFVQVMIDRWSMIDQAFSQYKISGTTILDTKIEDVAPYDMRDFLSMIEKDSWNHLIYAEIIKYRELISNCKIDQRGGFSYDRPVKISNLKKKFFFYNFLYKVNYQLTKNNNFFFVDYAVAGKKQIILDFLLAQITNIQPVNLLLAADKQKFDRSQVDLLDDFTPANEFERFLTQMIFKCMPSVYLSSFRALKKNASLVRWPSKPKVVICANAHNANDLFKVWLAEQKENNNTKLVIAQHGGNYGVAKFNFFEDLELSIADYYFSWGWKKKSFTNIYPMPSLKIERHRRQLKPDKSGGILIITGSLPRYSYFINSLPIGPQVEEYFSDMFDLVSYFNPDVFKRTIVRVYPYEDYLWDQKARWRKMFNKIKFDDDSPRTMYHSINNSRIVLCTYNSTTIMEVLAANIPTVLYWDPKYSEIGKSSERYFNKLLKAKVLYYNSIDAAKFINDNWDNFDTWWYSKDVQEAVQFFCGQYAIVSDRALLDWREILKKISNTR